MKMNTLLTGIVGTNDKSSGGQESRTAINMGGKVRPGSGSSIYAKGDVISEKLLIECKTTEKGSLRVQGKWLTKITKEAMVEEKDPALVFSMEFNDSMTEKDWIAVPMSVFRRLTVTDEGEE